MSEPKPPIRGIHEDMPKGGETGGGFDGVQAEKRAALQQAGKAIAKAITRLP